MKNTSSSRGIAAKASRQAAFSSLMSKAFAALLVALLLALAAPLVQSSYADDSGDKPVPGKKYGKITYTQNTENNGFLNSEYDKYRDGGTALGIANSFHIVAFDTLDTEADVYGNILAKNVSKLVDFGTDKKFVDIYGYNTLSYIQNYDGTFPRFDKSSDGCVVFGSDVNLTTRNNSELLINGSRIENPNSVVQDADTASNPFINLETLKSELDNLQNSWSSQSDTAVTKEWAQEGKVCNIKVDEGHTGFAYVNLSLSDLEKMTEGLNVDNLDISKKAALIINVDCEGKSSIDLPKTYLRINGEKVGIGETDEKFGDTGYIIYNLYNTSTDPENKTDVIVHECTASILAPNADLELGKNGGNACGTFIGNNVTVWAESHIRPFHGKDSEKETTSVSVSKVWKDAEGNSETDLDHDPITVELWYADKDGKATEPVVDSSGNTLTKELNTDNKWSASWDDLPTKADGVDLYYTVKENPVPTDYDCVIDHKGNVFTITNTHKTEEAKVNIAIEKTWNDNDDLDQIRPSSIELSLKRAIPGQEAKEYQKITLTAEDGWKKSITDLDKFDKDGNEYSYSLEELKVDGYEVALNTDKKTDDQGNVSYTFTLKNTHNSEQEFSLSGYSMRAADAPIPDADKVCYVDPKVIKVLDGRALKADEFSFQLIDEKTGNVVSEATNDEAGMVDFDKANNVTGDDMNPCCLSFTAAGTYTYTVCETPNQEKDSSIEYSTEVVKFVTTIVKDEAAGALVEKESHYVKYPTAADAKADTKGETYTADNHPSITNKLKPLSLALTKSDAETSELLSGATYGLYRVDESAPEGATQVMAATSKSNGQMVFTPADASAITTNATYFFREISAPDGYSVSENKTQNFTIEKSDDGYQLVYEDGSTSKQYAGTAADPIVYKEGTGVSDSKISVTFNKLASDGSAVAGAKLAVRDTESGEDIDTWTTDAVGHALTNLVVGKTYTLYETEAPEGYKTASEVEFVVDEYGKLSITKGAEDNDILNAYVEGSTLNLLDYKQDEIVNKKEVVKKIGIEKETSDSSDSESDSLAKTGDAAPVAALAPLLVLAGLGCCFASKRRRKE